MASEAGRAPESVDVSVIGSDHRELDGTELARRKWEARGWPTSEAMAAATSIMSAGRMIRAILDAELEAFGMSYSQYEVLGVLSFSRNSRMSMNKLSRHLGLHPASMTGIVDRLSTLGYVRRTTDPADRRMVHVELSPMGLRIVTAATQAIGAANFGMGNLDVDRLNILTEIIHDLFVAQGEVAKPAEM
jgi:DNA-binding MarR family transcriptional regulator